MKYRRHRKAGLGYSRGDTITMPPVDQSTLARRFVIAKRLAREEDMERYEGLRPYYTAPE